MPLSCFLFDFLINQFVFFHLLLNLVLNVLQHLGFLILIIFVLHTYFGCFIKHELFIDEHFMFLCLEFCQFALILMYFLFLGLNFDINLRMHVFYVDF